MAGIVTDRDALLTDEYWQTHRCVYCGNFGVTVIGVDDLVYCDCCGRMWNPLEPWTP